MQKLLQEPRIYSEVWFYLESNALLEKGDADCTFCAHILCSVFPPAHLSRTKDEDVDVPAVAVDASISIAIVTSLLISRKYPGHEHMTALESIESCFIGTDLKKQTSTTDFLKK